MLNGFACDLSGFMTFLLPASGLLSFPRIMISICFVFALYRLIFIAPRFTERLTEGVTAVDRDSCWY